MREYDEYIEEWLSGLDSEIKFWNNYMSNEGGQLFYGFEKTTSSNRRFELEEDIPQNAYGKDYSFIDVGSGPFSRCGRITNLVNLNALSVDPLAYAYNKLREKYKLDNGTVLESGFVELLDKKYEVNTFDMVHMSNALDHCFSPVYGIYQLLNICKIGGKVVLRHHENEALAENYAGLHQWNLSLSNEENSFIIWRPGYRYDICKIFSEYADFELDKDIKEKDGHWIYNKVILKKKKNVIIPHEEYCYDMMNLLYMKLLDGILDSSIESSSVNETGKIAKIKRIYHNIDTLNDFFALFNVKTVSIYGMGYVGKNLDYLISKSMATVTLKMDAKAAESGCFEAVKLDDIKFIDTDITIVTVDDEALLNSLRELGAKRIFKINDFLNNFDV